MTSKFTWTRTRWSRRTASQLTGGRLLLVLGKKTRGVSGGFAKEDRPPFRPEEARRQAKKRTQKAKAEFRGSSRVPDPSFPSLARSLPNRRRRGPHRRRSRRQRRTGHTAQGSSPASHPNIFAHFAGEASPRPRAGPRALLALDWRGVARRPAPARRSFRAMSVSPPSLPRCPRPPRCCDRHESN